MSPSAKVASATAEDVIKTAPESSQKQQQQQPEKFSVSFVDFELTSSDEAAASNGHRVNPNQLTGRIFYPADPTASTKARPAPRWATFRYSHAHARFLARLEKGADRPLQKVKTAVGAAVVHSFLVAANARVPADAGVAAPPLKKSFPAVVFSHGMGGTRACYAHFVAELAKLGFVVVLIEHADSTAAVAKLPAGKGFLYYEPWEGFGVVGDEQTARRGYVRRAELAAAVGLLRALASGGGKGGGGGGKGGDGGIGAAKLSLEGGSVPLDFFSGAIDAERVFGVGHSFGGAAVVDAAAGGAGEGLFSSVVALDPWYYALAEGMRNPAVSDDEGETRRSPLLIIGSDGFNTPDAEGKLECGGELQEKVLGAFSSSKPSPSKSKSSSKSKTDGGALFTILSRSSHTGFTDTFMLPGMTKWRNDQSATGNGGVGRGGGGGEEEEGESSSSSSSLSSSSSAKSSSSFVTEASDPSSTIRASAAMTAAFFRSRVAKDAASAPVDDGDRKSVEEAAGRIGVALRGVKVV